MLHTLLVVLALADAGSAETVAEPRLAHKAGAEQHKATAFNRAMSSTSSHVANEAVLAAQLSISCTQTRVHVAATAVLSLSFVTVPKSGQMLKLAADK